MFALSKTRCICAAALSIPALPGLAQDIEPRRWSHLPLGSNFAGVAYAYTEGDISLNPVLRIKDGEFEMHTAAFKSIANLRAYVDAQRQYAAVPRDGSKVRQFARKFQSASGKHDGLHWPADLEKGEDPSPAGPGIKDSETPHDGYQYKILTAQGESAPAGRFDYLINGHFIGGFALIAWPADYGRTGVMSFIVNHYGDVSERDLGPETSKLAAETTDYIPTKDWTAAEE